MISLLGCIGVHFGRPPLKIKVQVFQNVGTYFLGCDDHVVRQVGASIL